MNPNPVYDHEREGDFAEADAHDAWVSEWAKMGLAEMGRWLVVQSAFADYCRKRDAR